MEDTEFKVGDYVVIHMSSSPINGRIVKISQSSWNTTYFVVPKGANNDTFVIPCKYSDIKPISDYDDNEDVESNRDERTNMKRSTKQHQEINTKDMISWMKQNMRIKLNVEPPKSKMGTNYRMTASIYVDNVLIDESNTIEFCYSAFTNGGHYVPSWRD